MDKEILEQYIDACELIRETEEDIRRAQKQRKDILQDRVRGSMEEFPYAAQSFKIEGLAHPAVSDPGALEEYERILEGRKARAKEIKVQVEAWLNTVPQRMQRIIRYKFFEGDTWEQVAVKIGRKATADGVKMEFRRFLEKN